MRKLTCQILQDIFNGHSLNYFSIDKYQDQFITWQANGGRGFDILLCGEYFIKRCNTLSDLQKVFDVLGISMDVKNHNE